MASSPHSGGYGSPSWPSAVPVFQLETPSQVNAGQKQPQPQPHVRMKRSRAAQDAAPLPASLLHTPVSSASPSATSPSSAMHDIASLPWENSSAVPTGNHAIFSPPTATTPLSSSALPARLAAAKPSTRLPPSPAQPTHISSSSPISASSLHRLVQESLSHHQYTAAIFYADKLCSLSSRPAAAAAAAAAGSGAAALPSLRCLLLLADCYFRNGEYRRAVHALRTRSVVCPAHTVAAAGSEMDEVWRWIDEGGDGDTEDDADADAAAEDAESKKENADSRHSNRQLQAAALSLSEHHSKRRTSFPSPVPSSPSRRAELVLSVWHLLCLCLSRCRDYDDALLTLGVDDSAATTSLTRFALFSPPASLLSSLAFQRGELYAEQQNRARSLHWYQQALQWDSRCVQALDRVVDGRMCSREEERAIMAALRFQQGEDDWLQHVYANKLQQHDAGEDGAAAPTAPTSSLASQLLMTPAPADRSAAKDGSIASRLTLLTGTYGLLDNVELYTALVSHLYHRYDLTGALTLSSRLLSIDPYNPQLLPLHLLLLASTVNTSHLFYISHQLSTACPQSHLALYAIALYYSCTGKHGLARSFFSKASSAAPLFLPAYLGFAHSFASQEEGDQAMIAYRTAARLFEGSHVPLLCLGIEYARGGNWSLAEAWLLKALRLWPTDPLTLNELGVVAYRREEYGVAADYFYRSLSLIAATSSSSSSSPLSSAWESCCLNLGHTLRKQKRYKQALAAYQHALAPPAASLSASSASPSHLSIAAALAQGLDDGLGLGLGRSALPAAGGDGPAAAAGLWGGGGAVGGGNGFGRVVLTATGFTYHLMGELDRAIHAYHAALAAEPRDTVVSDLLTRALQEVAQRPTVWGHDMLKMQG